MDAEINQYSLHGVTPSFIQLFQILYVFQIEISSPFYYIMSFSRIVGRVLIILQRGSSNASWLVQLIGGDKFITLFLGLTVLLAFLHFVSWIFAYLVLNTQKSEQSVLGVQSRNLK